MFSHLGVTSCVGGLDCLDELAVEGLEATTALTRSAHIPLRDTTERSGSQNHTLWVRTENRFTHRYCRLFPCTLSVNSACAFCE